MRVRHEFEKTIEYEQALIFLKGIRCIFKKRYEAILDEGVLHVDIFKGDLEGLVLAEMEFPSVEMCNLPVKFPAEVEVIKEVSEDTRFLNSNLVTDKAVYLLGGSQEV